MQNRFLSHDAEAKALLAKMTLEEKVGQMCQPDQNSLEDFRDISRYFLGSLLSGGGSEPRKEEYTLEGWTRMVDSYQQEALKTRLAIPLLYGIDAVHGHNNIPGAVLFPHNIGLGCARNAGLVEEIARITAEEVCATGIHWTFAPAVCVPRDDRWGRTYEGFGEIPEIVKPLGAAAVRGYQGSRLDEPLSVLACAKHYLADGGTKHGTSGKKDGLLDQGDTQCDEEELRRLHLPGYLTAIKEGVATIMPSYSSWNGVKCSAHKYLLTDVLKEELGFEGFLVSDYDAIDQIDGDYKKCIELSVNAGMDMVMMTKPYRQFCRQLAELVREDRVPVSRINDAVTRILRVKFASGLMDPDRPPLTDRKRHESFGSAERRAVARQAVRESLVLLQNRYRVLPLSKSLGRVHVGGRGADDLGMQCGGWTISWQGEMGQPVPGGTSILSAIRDTVSKTTKVTFSKDGSGADGADVGIVVIGERPYAEWSGDRAVLALSEEDLEAVATMKKAEIPVVVILLSGRPLPWDGVEKKADALVAAWLPGSEGQGIADVLFGDDEPTGKLSFSWPRSRAQVPINSEDVDYDPLFPLGHGLGY